MIGNLHIMSDESRLLLQNLIDRHHTCYVRLATPFPAKNNYTTQARVTDSHLPGYPLGDKVSSRIPRFLLFGKKKDTIV